MNVSMGATVISHLKSTKPQSMKAIFISAIYVRKVSGKRYPDAHVEGMHDVPAKENHQKDLTSVGREKENTKSYLQINCCSPFQDLGRVPSGQCKFLRESIWVNEKKSVYIL